MTRLESGASLRVETKRRIWATRIVTAAESR